MSKILTKKLDKETNMRNYVIGLGFVVVAVVILFSTAGSASRYVDFETAKGMRSRKGAQATVHLIGTLPRQAELKFAPEQKGFSFLLTDEKGRTERVWHPKPMPTDFLRAEKVVLVGKYVKDKFLAKKLLLKCPSKYQPTTDRLRSSASE